MTITINVSQNAESTLKAEAFRTGLPVQQLIEQVIAERFEAAWNTSKESTQEFFDRIARPGPIVDISRENIYADF